MWRIAASWPSPDHEPVAEWTWMYQGPAIAAATPIAALHLPTIATILGARMPAPLDENKVSPAIIIIAGMAVRNDAMVIVLRPVRNPTRSTSAIASNAAQPVRR